MARSNYSRYEYETSPRKLEPYYAHKKKITEVKRETKQENKKKQKAENKLKAKAVMYLFVILGVFFAITYRNAKIDENFDKVQDLK